MKQTEIDGVADTLIPDDWEVKRLGEIGEPCMCKRILKEQTSPTGDIPFYKIGTFGGIPDAYISRELFEQYKEQYNYPKKGTLLLSAAGTIGRVVVFDGKDSYFQDSNIVWIDNDETKVTNDFLFYCYSRMQWKTEEGGIVSRLYNANLKSTSFIAPKSLAEQQRIAKALSDVDALISTTEKLIQKKKNIKQGTMQNLLTGKKRLPGFGDKQTDLFVPNGTHTKEVKDVSPEQIRLSAKMKQTELGEIPEDWEVKSLGEMLKIGHGKDYKNLKSGNVPVYGTGGYMTSVNDFLYEGETVCIGRKGTIDKPQYHSGKIWTVDTLFYTYDFKSLNPKYLFYKFCLIDWLSMNEASGVPSLTAKNIEDIQITIPTEEEQTAIANVLSSMDKEIETLNTKLEKYRNLKTAMMQQLLTGKIRFVK
ncbi:MAG: restriction endonuclease subunit S [Treponema sp.]|nr:MAG: restriction endonuclease subunit S [Treponema sp.]